MSSDVPPQLIYPRLTLDYLKSRIASEHYHYFEETRTTVCSVLLVNGFSITVSVVCTNAEQYDETTGRKHALTKALEKIRKREYYLLKQRLYDEQQNLTGQSNG